MPGHWVLLKKMYAGTVRLIILIDSNTIKIYKNTLSAIEGGLFKYLVGGMRR